MHDAPTSDWIRQSQAYAQVHRIGETERLVVGFRDPGRGVGIGNDGRPMRPPRREMLIVRPADEDESLREARLETRARAPGLPSRIDRIAWLMDRIAAWMPENDPERNAAIIAGIAGEAGLGGAEIPVGRLIAARTGVCRHRSLLFKLLADDICLPTALVRGNYARRGADAAGDGRAGRGGHAWNECILETGERIVVDAMHDFVGALDHRLLRSYAGVEDEPLYPESAAAPDAPAVRDRASAGDLAALDLGRWVSARGRSGAYCAYAYLDAFGAGEEARLRHALQSLGLRHDAHRTGLGGVGESREVIRVRGAALFELSRLGVSLNNPAPPRRGAPSPRRGPAGD